MNRTEWLERRKSGIGGSDVAAILGISPWATPLSVWLDKTGQSVRNEQESEALRFGTYNEEYCARRYTEETERNVERYNGLLSSADGILIGNVDRLVAPSGRRNSFNRKTKAVTTDTILECKTASMRIGWEDDSVPAHYQAQVQHYMGLCPSVTHTDFAVLFHGRGMTFEMRRVERDDKVIEEINERCREFWNKYVMTETPPPPTSEEEARILWRVSRKGTATIADDSAIVDAVNLVRTNAIIERLGQYADALKARIMGAIGDTDELKTADGQTIATWRTASGARKTDWKSLAASLCPSSELVERFTKESAPSRRFILKSDFSNDALAASIIKLSAEEINKEISK